MKTLLQTIAARTPRCLAQFKTSANNVVLSDQRVVEPDSITKAIECICGNSDLYLEAARRKDLKGTCRQDEIITPIPPVYVSCIKCGRLTLLFDPLVHGWNAETNKERDSDDASRLVRCTPNVGKVYVSYAYRNLERYTKLMNSGVGNPEDYFDKFVVLFGNSSGEKIDVIVSIDCG